MNSSDGSRHAFVCGICALTLALTLVLAACSGSTQKGSVAQSAPSVPAAAAPSAPSSAPASGAPTSGPSTSAAPAAGAPASVAAPSAAAPPSGACGDARYCYEAPDFTATVTNFRTSIVSGYRVLDATIRFQNKTARPLTLGYANASGVAVDEKGNRYIVGGPNGFRGIGLVNGQTADPRFVVAPGSSGDARFELSWFPGNAIIGSTFELDLTVNEIETLEGNQHRVGGEFPLTFRGLLNELPK